MDNSDKTFQFLAQKHQMNSLEIIIDFVHCIFLKNKQTNKTLKETNHCPPLCTNYFLNMRDFWYYDSLKDAYKSEFHTPGSYRSRPVIKAMQNTDITGCTVVHLLLTCLPFGFRKHQLFKTLQLIINGEERQESLFLQTFKLVIRVRLSASV